MAIFKGVKIDFAVVDEATKELRVLSTPNFQNITAEVQMRIDLENVGWPTQEERVRELRSELERLDGLISYSLSTWRPQNRFVSPVTFPVIEQLLEERRAVHQLLGEYALGKRLAPNDG